MHRGNYANILCKSVFKTSLCTRDKKLEWPHAGRKSVLLIPVSWETFVSLFSPAGPLGSPSGLRLTSDRAAPLSFKASSCAALPGKSSPAQAWVSHQLCGRWQWWWGGGAEEQSQEQPPTPHFNSPEKALRHKENENTFRIKQPVGNRWGLISALCFTITL